MKKFSSLVALLQLALFVPVANATVTVTTGPVSLVTSPQVAPASSAPLALFKFSLGQDAGETLSSVNVTLTKVSGSTLAGSDLASVAVYKDNGDGSFNAGSDLLAGSQSTVNVDSATTITTGSNNTIGTGATFFVTVATGSTWSDTATADGFTAQLATDAIVTSANSPTTTAVTTAMITADTTGPHLTSAVAMNTGGTSAKEAGDSVVLTFNEATNKPVITVGSLPSVFGLSSGHSFLDGLGVLMSASWNAAGTAYTITLSGNGSLPTVEPGDTVTVMGSVITDGSGNSASGSMAITGSFTSDVTGPVLTSAVAANTGGTIAKEAGDSVAVTFNEATNKPAITDSNINTTFTLNNSHSWLDGAGHIGSAVWNAAGTIITITLSGATSVPTVAVGDTVTMAGSVVQDASGNSATGSSAITGTFTTTDTTGPVLTSAVAQNTGGTNATEAGDSVVLTFGEATNKPTITDSNINSTLMLNNSHSWLDGAGHIGSAAWDLGGTMLTITLSAGTSLPTVTVGDTVTMAGSVIKDAAGNNATGSHAITGSFSGENENRQGKVCANGLINGRLYQVTGSTTVYLAANCNLKVFKGRAVGHAKGKKFKNIISLQSLTGLTVSAKPQGHKSENGQGQGENDNEHGKSGTQGLSNQDSQGNHDKSEGKGNGKHDD